jgi:hypothetical protein
MTRFHEYIGIDYSGAGTPLKRLRGLQVYAATNDGLPERVSPPSLPNGSWCRKDVAAYLIEKARSGRPFIAGLDFSFSLPLSYLQWYGLDNWNAFLADFVEHWPTDQDDAKVGHFLKNNPRTGTPDEFRLTEKWTSSAKSNFHFGVPGAVATSTHAGIPWLYRIRQKAGEKVHFWPFDGWEVGKGKSVIAEAYPSILRRRYPKEGRTTDQHDAYAIARWLKEMETGMALDEVYFQPPLNEQEMKIADMEGWILGIV